MKNLLLAFLGIVCGAVNAAALTDIQVYGSSSTLGTSFSVSVSAPDGTLNQSVPVELIRPSNTTLNFARFAFSGTVQVTVKVPNVANYSISPRRYELATTVDSGQQTMRFTISNDANSAYYRPDGVIKLVLHDHYGTGPSLFLFADKKRPEPLIDGVTAFSAADYGIVPAASDNTAAINSAIQSLSAKGLSNAAMLYFPAGVYRTRTVVMKSNVALFLSGQAVLMGPDDHVLSAGAFVTFNSVNNAHIRGPGIVNANIWHANNNKIVFMDGATNSSLQDVLFTGTGNWSIHILNSADILGRNYKLINEFTDNSDGTDPDHSVRVTIDDIFEHTKDDGFAVKTSPGSSGITDAINISNSVIWTQKSALKIGSEVTTALKNVTFSNNQVVYADRALAVYGNGSGVAGGSVDKITFTGNTIEKIVNLTFGKLVDFSVLYFSNPAPYAPISNIIVGNTFCYAPAPNVSKIDGLSGTLINNVTFTQFWMDSAHGFITTANGNVGQHFAVGQYAKNVTFGTETTPPAAPTGLMLMP